MLEKGDIFLSKAEIDRIKLQTKYEKIYLSEHIWQTVIREGRRVAVDPLVPIPALISELSSDLLFGEFPQFNFVEDAAQRAAEDYLKSREDLQKMLRIDLLEASVYTSAQGMIFWNLFRDDKEEVFWNFQKPQKVLWEMDFWGLINVKFFELIEEKNNELTYSIQEHELLRAEGIEPQHIFREMVIKVDGINQKIKKVFLETERATGLNFIPVIPVYNLRNLGIDIGRSDYEGKQQIFAEIDNRVDQINNVLQEHSDPWEFVPPGVLDVNGRFNRSNGKMVEKGASANSQDNTVDIVTWDASLEAAFKQVDNLIRLAFQTSRISKPLSGFDNSGTQIDSGRALKWQSVSTIGMKNRKEIYWGEAIKLFFKYLGKMQAKMGDLNMELKIEWADGLPLDEAEKTNTIVSQVTNELKSKLKGIQQVQEVGEAEANEELEQIKKEAGDAADIRARSIQPVTL